jgi:FkbH-like protein
MTTAPSLYWLPTVVDWRKKLLAARSAPEKNWGVLVDLANSRLDFMSTNGLDALLQKTFPEPPGNLATRPIRLALLGSSTLTHLQPAIRVACLRRGLHVTIYECAYGQFMQEMHDTSSDLHAFKPNLILYALDGIYLTAGLDATAQAADAAAEYMAVKERIENGWSMARQAFNCPILHQTPLPVLPNLIGNNEQRVPGSRAAMIARLNADLRPMADKAGVHLVALDYQAARDGIAAWHDTAMWHRAKQEVSPAAAPVYGDLVARILAAAQGRSAKCLVLDLDNTIWGGVVGDDGLEGLVIGQGSSQGEAFLEVQRYARELSRRGIILAVCSKNNEVNALEPFEKHPEMLLRRNDIASFVANWSDKAGNIRAIALELNIGLDSLVFLDDNPFERNLVRQELPMVSVPEVPEDPALVPQCLADAGYFEGLGVTDEDRDRASLYRTNRERETLKSSATDIASYLQSLEMKLKWRLFDKIGLARTVQLINKTNQFNLRTQRYTEQDVLAVIADNQAFGLQIRLIDRFGDNGIISIVIGRAHSSPLASPGLTPGDVFLDTWLMSCRVLGRQVEEAVLNLVVQQSQRLGGNRLVGEYRPTPKNDMVKDLYARLGFNSQPTDTDESFHWTLELADFKSVDTYIDISEEK